MRPSSWWLAPFGWVAACGGPASLPAPPERSIGFAVDAGSPAATVASLTHSITVLLDATSDAGVSAAGLDSPEVASAMASLARVLVARAPDVDDEEALRRRALWLVAAAEPAAANAALARLRNVARPYDAARARVLYTHLEVHSRARLAGNAGGLLPFAEALKSAFRETFSRLDDLAAEHARWRTDTDLDGAVADVRGAIAAARSAPSDRAAGDLVVRYAEYVVRRDLLPLGRTLLEEDAAGRYEIEEVLVPMRDGAKISATVVRPRRVTTPQPAILVYSIYTTSGDRTALASAARGYVGVAAYTRGKRKSSGEVVPYEREANDTHDTIDWLAKQGWCDGRVAMYGGSYAGFTQWAATKHLHPALKTIVPYVAAIPGQGLPMENNVFLNVNYGWAFYVGSGKEDDDRVYFDAPRWNALPGKWFASGRPFREIDRVDGVPNRLLQRWIAHPSYDAYWQAMVPVREEYARIDIPVLSITGYYDDGQISALRYFTEHTRYAKNARHHLLIGPYDHFGAQRRPADVLRGYAIDPVARIDTTAITFQWLDHVLRGGPLPEIVKDKVNWEVMGANEWRHAPSIEKMHDEVMTLYTDGARLVTTKPDGARFVAQQIDFSDRTTSNNSYYPDPIVSRELDAGNGVVLEGEPFAHPASIDGIFTGELHVRVDKKDMDVGVQLYEKTADGAYFALTYYLGRASYARDMSVRRLLVPGAIEMIPFERTRMVSRRIEAGSRLVVVLNVNKNAFAQVNHGTGKDVSDESSADAKTPLHVEWHADGFVRIPIRR